MPDLNLAFLLDVISIFFIDVILAGDNAVVIAMAVRSLDPKQRRLGILLGAGMAVALRVAITFFAAQLLQWEFVRLVGGAVILWIGVKLLIECAGDAAARSANNLWHAMWMILIADLTMSIDNILAVAGASKGNFGLLLFGLGASIPFVVFASNILSTLMDRYPIIVYIGSAVLGRVGGEMLMTDPWVVKNIAPEHWMVWVAEAVCAVAVVVLGWRFRLRAEPCPPGIKEPPSEPAA